MTLAGKLFMFWIAAVAIGGGYAGMGVLTQHSVAEIQVVAQY